MSTDNPITYAQYKRAQSRLVHWVVHTSNTVRKLESNPALTGSKPRTARPYSKSNTTANGLGTKTGPLGLGLGPGPDQARALEVALTPTTTAEIRLAILVELCELISQHLHRRPWPNSMPASGGYIRVPNRIYKHLQTLIEARLHIRDIFLRISNGHSESEAGSASHSEPKAERVSEFEREGTLHEEWIEALSRVFTLLDGEGWFLRQGIMETQGIQEGKEDGICDAVAGLDLNGDRNDHGNGEQQEDDGEDDEDDVEDDEPANLPSPTKGPRVQKKGKKGRGKKSGKGHKKSKSKSQAQGKPSTTTTTTTKANSDLATAAAKAETALSKIPIEQYRIIENVPKTGIPTDYILATSSLTSEIAELRTCMQKSWRQVGYHGLNSAIAGTLGNIAVGMVKRAQRENLVDFPGGQVYGKVVQGFTRVNSDPDTVKGIFGESAGVHGRDVDIDVKEHLMLHTYTDLLAFITDYRKTLTGKPSKSMLKSLKWDPDFNLQRATKEERLLWRRSYTINWLYDLVNLFSSAVIQKRRFGGEDIPLESVNWHVYGNVYRRLYGLNEFAAEITTLVMNKQSPKPGVCIEDQILPHTVFQLQIIVDALCVTRGWTPGGLSGDILTSPAPNFKPRRDIDLFLDRNNERKGRGYPLTTAVLASFLQKDSLIYGDADKHKNQIDALTSLSNDFLGWLGESQYAQANGIEGIPASRFTSSSSTPNGLWEFSPYLCGAGLMEALELVHGTTMQLWDRLSLITAILHLHNMLLQRGYLKSPIGIFECLQFVFPSEFYIDGLLPRANFYDGLRAVFERSEIAKRESALETIRRHITGKGVKIDLNHHTLIDTSGHHQFKTKSLIRHLREADWIPECIPDEVVPIYAGLAAIRLGNVKRVVDEDSGEVKLEDSVLVKRFRERGIGDEQMVALRDALDVDLDMDLDVANDVDSEPGSESGLESLGGSYSNIGTPNLFRLLENDIKGDVCLGARPMLGLNYSSATSLFFMVMHTLESRLREISSPLYTQAYGPESESGSGNQEPSPTPPGLDLGLPGKLVNDRRVTLIALAMRSEDETVLGVMAECFRDLGLGYKDLTYWEESQMDYEEHFPVDGGFWEEGGE
ncbi:hypothetical protein BDV06DRAFT_193402 [Aspergillus oleicola]